MTGFPNDIDQDNLMVDGKVIDSGLKGIYKRFTPPGEWRTIALNRAIDKFLDLRGKNINYGF